MVKVRVGNRELKCLFRGDGTPVVRACIEWRELGDKVGREDEREDKSEEMARNVSN